MYSVRHELFYYTSFLSFCQVLFSKPAKLFLRCRKFKRELIYYTSLFRFCQYPFSGFWYFLKSCDVTRLFRACLLYNICYFLSSTFLYLAKILWTVSPAPNAPAYYTPFIPFCQAENNKFVEFCRTVQWCVTTSQIVNNIFIVQPFIRKLNITYFSENYWQTDRLAVI